MQDKRLLWGGLAVAAGLTICCLGILIGSAITRNQTDRAAPYQVETLEPLPASLPPPTMAPTAITVTEIAPGQSSDAAAVLQALSFYAETIKPLLDQGLAAAQRDGEILELSKENPDALCGGPSVPHPTLTADATLINTLTDQLNAVTPPIQASGSVHNPLRDSFKLWGEALDSINSSCQAANEAERNLLRLGAGLQLGGSMINFHIASDNFWKLVIINGLEAITGPRP